MTYRATEPHYSSIQERDQQDLGQASKPIQLLHLLQLTNSALPVGAYSYSEGLESLVDLGCLPNASTLQDWLESDLKWGVIRVEGAIALRIYRAMEQGDVQRIKYWNQWLSASRETEELREQSWQMGRALTRLLLQLDDKNQISAEMQEFFSPKQHENYSSVNYATAFAIATFHRHIPLEDMLLGYLHSWASNLIAAGIKLIPIGQTEGQQVLCALYPTIEQSVKDIFMMPDDDLSSCSWGFAIASMHHQTLYSRLFRS